jgi:TonB family protein
MRHAALSIIFSACTLLSAQDTISVDAVSVMQVCSDKHPASAGTCAVPPRTLSKINPVYPEKARQSRAQGTVVLNLVVRTDGTATNVRAVSGPSDELNRAAIDAVTQWKFDPATYEGKPVDVEMTVQVNFRLEATAAEPQQHGAPANRNQLGNLYTDADEALRRGDYQTAANLARRITDLAPQHSSAWNLLGRSLFSLNEPEAAADAFVTQIKVNPSSTVAYNNLGLVYWRQHKYDDAAAQFRKQLVINPDDHYAHSNLGMMLRDQKKCNEAMPELQKGLSISPNKPDALIALGECEIDLGNRAKGVSELEQATSSSSAPGTFNSAAYALAKRNIELDRAEKWSETCLTIESARLRSISLDHLTPEQLNFVTWIAAYWDTRGWTYFQRGDNASAESYIEPSWHLFPTTETGDHLAQVYEKIGKRDEAIRTYAMAIAAADRPGRFKADEDDIADAKLRLSKLDLNLDKRIERGETELGELSAISIPNASKSAGQGDFTLRLTGEAQIEARRISGDASLDELTQSLQTARLPIQIPPNAKVEIPVRGTLTCKSGQDLCRFVVFSPDAAVDLARKELATDTTPLAGSVATDPHFYDNPGLGMRISLPDGWQLVKEEPGSFSLPHNVTFGKPGSAAFFVLTRLHMESTPDLYKKMVQSNFSQHLQYQRNGEEDITRDGLPGTRWTMTWKDKEVTYFSIMEFFTVGDDHYHLMALAPKEIYDRYAETFANIMHSVRFPMLHTDPRILGGVK